uniref:Uncharacterized protein n=1 Tax=Lygus hesperus TaxID=30085 RepID=A0A146M1X0_LYGHE
MGVPSLFKEAHLLYDSLQSAASTDERKTTAAGHHTLSVNHLQADVQNCRCEPEGGTHYATSACSQPSVRRLSVQNDLCSDGVEMAGRRTDENRTVRVPSIRGLQADG